MNVSNTLPSADDPRDLTLPLWRRTQLRFQNMETWSVRHRNSSDGFDERIQLQDQRIALACRHLVLLIKEREERKTGPLPLNEGGSKTT